MFIDPINYRHFLLALKVHCNSHYTDIYIANSYLLVSTTSYRYVIGIADGDTRLFVNKVDREPYGDELVVSFRKGERRINIYKTGDDEIWSILGFKYNAVGEEILIDRPGIYRIQGDLILEVDGQTSFNPVNVLSNVQERLLTDLLLRVLTEMRVSAEVGLNNNIIVPIKVPVKDIKIAIKHIDNISNMVIEKVATQLYNKLRELGLARELKLVLTWKAIIDADGSYRNCDIQVFDERPTHGYDNLPYIRMNLVILARCNANASEGTLLKKMYDDFMQLYKPRTFEFTVGNHHIRMENAYSTTIRYKPKWQPLLLGDLVVEINEGQGWYHVTPESTITITHDEHGTTRLRFTREFRIRFWSLNLSDDHDQERNAIALNLISTTPELPVCSD
jgi:hypothetical protein